MREPKFIVLPTEAVDPDDVAKAREVAKELAGIVDEINASLGDPTAELTGGLRACTCCPVHGPHND